MSSPTGDPTGLSQWSTEITVEFVQVPEERREQYWAALAWIADEIQKGLTAPKAVEAVSG